MFFSKLWFWLLIILVVVFGTISVSFATTNINSASSSQVAWSDVAGWINLYETNTVTVTGERLQGYASSSVGDISFDCATSPSGNVCGSSSYYVCNGVYSSSTETCTGNYQGSLSGYAWNDTIGWISFNCYNHGNCVSSNYSVTVNPNTGDFTGYAWNDTIGWISFNCVNHSGCGVSNYLVNTDWRQQPTIGYLESATIDTQIVGGATLNGITWQGVEKVYNATGTTYVGFQIATATSTSGPWTYYGPGGSTTNYYDTPCSQSFVGGTGYSSAGAPQDEPICIDPSQVANKRYLRYKFQLRSNLLQTDTPRIDKIILNWSK
jgi:hypothetical protein